MLVFIESRMDETYQGLLHNVLIFVIIIFVWDMFSLKYHFSSNTNRVDSVVVAVNRKIHHFSTPNGIKVQGYTTLKLLFLLVGNAF